MTLRSGGGPARLLLWCWRLGMREDVSQRVEPGPDRSALLRHEFIAKSPWSQSYQNYYCLTPAGREAAQALQASS